MTIFDVLTSPSRMILMTMLLLLAALQLYRIFASFENRRRTLISVLYIAHFLISAALLYLFLLSSYRAGSDPSEIRMLPKFYSAFTSLPVLVVYIYEIITAVILAAEFIDLIRFRKNHLTAASIKETMDLLPAGIAADRADGTIVFRNIAMNKLIRLFTGKGTISIGDFIGKAEEETTIALKAPDGSGVCQFELHRHESKGEEYLHLIATDITRQSEITAELEEKNKILRDIRMRLDIYNKHADRMIISQELLTARMEVHNEVGNVLLESRHYLNDPASYNEEQLLNALKNTNTYLLREYEEDDTERDPLLDALDMAETIGVEVLIKGVIPSGKVARNVLAAAVTECSTNTVKHAQGNLLNVDIQSKESDLIYKLQSNGIPPEGAVNETGGLASLRALIERENGTMQICTGEEFIIMIKLSL